MSADDANSHCRCAVQARQASAEVPNWKRCFAMGPGRTSGGWGTGSARPAPTAASTRTGMASTMACRAARYSSISSTVRSRRVLNKMASRSNHNDSNSTLESWETTAGTSTSRANAGEEATACHSTSKLPPISTRGPSRVSSTDAMLSMGNWAPGTRSATTPNPPQGSEPAVAKKARQGYSPKRPSMPMGTWRITPLRRPPPPNWARIWGQPWWKIQPRAAAHASQSNMLASFVLLHSVCPCPCSDASLSQPAVRRRRGGHG